MAEIKLLAFDTSTEACSAALFYNEQIISRYEIAPRKHTALILPFLQTVLAEGGLTLAQLDAIAFGCGPGSFTGVRIAASVVQGIAFAADLPVIPVSTLRALAQGAYREFAAPTVYAALDAQMNEVYWGVYGLSSDKIMKEIMPESVCDPRQVVTIKEANIVGVGQGWDAYPELLKSSCGTGLQKCIPNRYPNAQDIAIIAAADYQQGRVVKAEQALPVYLRDKVV